MKKKQILHLTQRPTPTVSKRRKVAGGRPTWSQVEIVTLALYDLGGAEKPIETEDVAFTANQLAPGRFTWTKYRDQINLELIRVFLSDAKKIRPQPWIEGSGRTGWSLTSTGRGWARNVRASSPPGTGSEHDARPRTRTPSNMRRNRERARIETTSAWRKWNSTDSERAAEVLTREAMEVFRIDSYSNQRTRALKIGRVTEMFAEDPVVRRFLDEISALIDASGSDDD